MKDMSDANDINSITGDYLLSLLFLPMTDERILDVVTAFGWQLPDIDERYEEEGKVAIQDEDRSGLALVFREVAGANSKSGDLQLAEIDFSHDRIVPPPFGLRFADDYKSCCEKLGGKADYQSKRIKELKIWVKDHPSGRKYSIGIFFNKNMIGIRSIVATDFDSSEVGRYIVDAD